MVWAHLTQFVALAPFLGAAIGRQRGSSSSNASHTASDDFVEIKTSAQRAVLAPRAAPTAIAPRAATRAQDDTIVPPVPRRGRNRSATAPNSMSPASPSCNNNHHGNKSSRRGKRGSGATRAKAMRRQESAPSMRSAGPALPALPASASLLAVSPGVASPLTQQSPLSSSSPHSPSSPSPSSPLRSWPRTAQQPRHVYVHPSPSAAHNEAWWRGRLPAASSSTATAGPESSQTAQSASDIVLAQRFRARSIDEVVFSSMESTAFAPRTPLQQVPQPILRNTNPPARAAAVSSAPPPPPPPSVNTRSRRSSSLPSSSPKSSRVDPHKYKTEPCRNWDERGSCPVRDCQFAHGDAELRPRQRHPLWKTQKCRSFHGNGHCDYGARCDYIHDEPLPANTSPPTHTSNGDTSAVASSSMQVTFERQGSRNDVTQEPLLARIGLNQADARVSSVGAPLLLLSSQHSIWNPLPPVVDRTAAAPPSHATHVDSVTTRRVTTVEETSERLHNLRISPYTIAAHQALGGGGSWAGNSASSAASPPQPSPQTPPSTPDISSNSAAPGSWHCNAI